MNISEKLKEISDLIPSHVSLVAVSKTKPNSAIIEAYNAGQRIFGENKVQDLVKKQEELPKDIEWHFIGHIQSNKVKYIAPFVSLLHGVDSEKILRTINKEGAKANRKINCLLQVHIAQESTKFGFSPDELIKLVKELNWDELEHVEVCGLMGMASNTTNTEQIKEEFQKLKSLFDQLKINFFKASSFKHISMGMSNDYQIAIEEGSNMVRIGSTIFGSRQY